MIQKVFNRYEKKYLLDQKTYEVFKKELDVYMAEDSTYFFEIKKKYNGLVNKRRIPLSREEAKKYLEEGDAPKETGQIYREVDYFFTHYGIRPKRYIAYDRLAPGYYLMEVKISDAMPKWFVDLLSKYGIYNTSFSKYGMDQWRNLHCDCGRRSDGRDQSRRNCDRKIQQPQGWRLHAGSDLLSSDHPKGGDGP